MSRRKGSLTIEERELCHEIFGAIADDDALAADIVTRIRALVRRESLPEQPVRLNEVARVYDGVEKDVKQVLRDLELEDGALCRVYRDLAGGGWFADGIYD